MPENIRDQGAGTTIYPSHTVGSGIYPLPPPPILSLPLLLLVADDSSPRDNCSIDDLLLLRTAFCCSWRAVRAKKTCLENLQY